MSAQPGTTRPRIPDTVKREHGTLHPELVNKKLPKKPFVIPPPPDDMSAAEKKNYESFARRIGNSRITTEDDAEALRMLTIYWTRWNELAAELRKFEHCCWVIEEQTKYGVVRKMMPEWKASLDVDTKVLGLLGRFGMTPADRGRVSVIDGDSDEKKSENEFN